MFWISKVKNHLWKGTKLKFGMLQYPHSPVASILSNFYKNHLGLFGRVFTKTPVDFLEILSKGCSQKNPEGFSQKPFRRVLVKLLVEFCKNSSEEFWENLCLFIKIHVTSTLSSTPCDKGKISFLILWFDKVKLL